MTTVTESAMLAKLTISRWSASKHDKTVSADVAAQHGSDATMGRYTKRLIAASALEEIGSLVAQARHHHYENTLPWTDEGMRILPAANYFDYIQAQHDFEHRMEVAAAKFAADYPAFVAAAKQSLNGLFNPADYPDPSEVAGLFSMRTEVSPMPDPSDFRVKLGDAEEARVRSEIETRVDCAVQNAISDLWQRIHDQVGRMIERLRAYQVDGDGKVLNTFRDSLVGNMRELVDVLGRLNFTGSNYLEDMRGRLEQELCAFEGGELRGDEALRDRVAESAEKILEDVKEFLA